MNTAEKELVLSQNNLTIAENMKAVYEAGKGAMWDGVQNYGNRKDYDKGFAYWGNEELSPNHKVSPNGKCTEIFHGCTALKRIDESKFDLSKAKYSPTGEDSATFGTFWLCGELEVVPDIGLQAGAYSNTYAGCIKMHTIKKLRVTEDCTFSETVFVGCPELQNIEDIEGTIGQNIFINGCPKLSPDSLKRIIKHLKDFWGSGNELTTTLYVNKTAWDALEAEGFNDEDKAWYENWLGDPFPDGYNWFFAVFDLCWNLTLQE